MPTSISYNLTKDDNNLRIIVINCRSIKGKIAELAQILNYTLADIVLLTETHMAKEVLSTEILPPNYYEVARKDRAYNAGGVLIAARMGIQAESVPLKDITAELVFGKILLEKNRPYYIGCFYNNDGSLDDFKQLDKALDHFALIDSNPI